MSVARAVASAAPAGDAPKRYLAGTHRVCPPEETLARVAPMMGAMGITRLANASRYASTLSILTLSGVPLVEAMEIAGNVVSNRSPSGFPLASSSSCANRSRTTFVRSSPRGFRFESR